MRCRTYWFHSIHFRFTGITWKWKALKRHCVTNFIKSVLKWPHFFIQFQLNFDHLYRKNNLFVLCQSEWSKSNGTVTSHSKRYLNNVVCRLKGNFSQTETVVNLIICTKLLYKNCGCHSIAALHLDACSHMATSASMPAYSCNTTWPFLSKGTM